MKRNFKYILYMGLGLSLSPSIFASGYRMEFQSASILGDAGEAAVVEDAGTNWYNSAGLVYLPRQTAFSLIDVYAPTKFTGRVVAPTPIPPPFNILGSSFAAAGSASSHPNSVIPAFHISWPYNPCLAFGFSMVPGWGFLENYGNQSIVRYNLTRVYTKTLEFAPSVAWKINHQWSLGAGPNIHYFSVLSRDHVRTEGVPPIGTIGDSVQRFSADNWGYGGHAGVLFRFNDTTRFGLNYRTKMIMDLSGYSDFLLNNGPVFESHNFKLRIPLPPSTTFTAYHDFNPCFALMGTIAYDQWSILQTYHAKNLIEPPSPLNPSGNIPIVNLPQEMNDTIDVSIGAHYKLNEKWMLRGSVKYEPTPTKNQFRALNFPDGEKLGFQIGSRFKMNPKIAIDLLYGHVFVRRMQVQDVNPITNAKAIGHQNTTIDLLGGQVVWDIC